MRATVHPGPWLLRPGATDLVAHRERFGALPRITAAELVGRTEAAGVLGRGGAGFPYARKLATACGRRSLRRHLVVNLSEGEPASAKDAALARTAPHLVLDGAVLTARALRAREIHLVLPGEDVVTVRAIERALAERGPAQDRGLRWRRHRAEHRFVSGESSAALELVRGHENLPVTSWEPAAVRGLDGRPTMVCNAETMAQVAALVLDQGAAPGPAGEPGTRILSVTRGEAVHVLEVAHGAAWEEVLTEDELGAPVLLGGYHGSWVAAHELRGHAVSARSPFPLGAGIVIPLPPGSCPLERTTELLEYLAGQSARRCGPCVHGLPALAAAHAAAVAGGGTDAAQELVALVTGRGACAHPDGTARLAASALTAFGPDLEAHRTGGCLFRPARVEVGAR